LAGFAKGGVFRPLAFLFVSSKFSVVPWSLKRFQQSRQLHFITFSCYRRQPRLNTPRACRVFLRQLEIARRRFAMCVYGYVLMPEHVHLLLNEPESRRLSTVIQSLKQTVARVLGFEGVHFWQRRYYDFNVWSERKRVEKLRYIHRNPVMRGLVEKPEDWPGAVFGIISTAKRASWRLSRSGHRENARRWESVRSPQCGWGSKRPHPWQKRPRVGHPRVHL